jgi:predicted nucleotidyltransferase component of viral defense system
LIPAASITAWRQRAPWPDDVQVEQDLILTRLMVEIASHELLGPELVLRGGTCLHKMHLPRPLRYSEDLDYVRRTRSGIGPYLDAIREVATGIGLEDRGTNFSGQMAHSEFDADPTAAAGHIRVKIETNVRETEAFLPRTSLPVSVESPWWSGEADVSTFRLEELMGTKLRALYQRRKGRDLFDLWYVLAHLKPDAETIVGTLAHYMGPDAFTYPQLKQNLREKLEDRDFQADLSQLVTDAPTDYDAAQAAELVLATLGPYLGNPPA